MALKQFLATGASESHLNYEAMRALVVDDYPGMRSAFKNTLANFGLSRIDLATSASEAIHRVKNSSYDIIICDYNLGDGRDGQQLLEELRYRQLMSLESAFVMVTAESLYEKVVSTAELAPDDYLIKPFSAEVLRSRLEVILLRKRAFAEVYRLFANRELEEAMAACDRLMQENPKYVVDALRFKGELLNAMGKFEEAEGLYKRIIEMRAVPWARLGLAKALHSQDKEEEAEELLSDIIDNNPELVAAYDLLADVRLAKKDTHGAQAALQQGATISSKTVTRQQKLGDIAYRNGDLDTAKKAFSTALEKGRHSVFVTAKDYANLCRVQVDQGNISGAADTLRGAKAVMRESEEGKLAAAIMESIVHTKAGRAEAAKQALDEATRLHRSGVRGEDRLMMDLAESCMLNGRHDDCDAVVSEVAKNAHDSEVLLAKARKIYADAGREDMGTQVLSKATAAVRKLNNEGVMLAQKGDLAGAVEKLLSANREAPYNPRIAMNAAWIVLRCIEQQGMDHDMLNEAIRLIDDAAHLAPDHARIPGLRSKIRELEAQYGINRK